MVYSIDELSNAIASKRHICISSLNPLSVFQHLALEEWILTFLEKSIHFNDDYRILLLYINRPCVVIGRNQVIWKECDPAVVPTARRMSGGGAVYHDLGNLNFSLFTSRPLFKRERGTEALYNTLRLQIPASLLHTTRFYDIFLHEKKISGSAFRIAKRTAYHHGTALFFSDLGVLAKALRPKEFPEFSISSIRASESKRSFVTNIHDHYPTIGMDLVIHHMSAFLDIPNFYSIGNGFAFQQNAELMKIQQTLQSPEWIIGNNPEFNITCRSTGIQKTIQRGTIGLSSLEFGHL